MSDYDGTWQNDPLDLRCIRLDAEIEAGIYSRDTDVWSPKTLQDCYAPEFEDYTKCSSVPPERFLKPSHHCFILDKDDNIVEKYLHDPYHAKMIILEKYDKSHKILLTKTLEFVTLQEADEYE